MNLNKSLLALCLAFGLAGTAAAQSCASPLTMNFANRLAPVATGDTCTATNSITDICDGASPSPGNDLVYAININSAGADGYTAQNIVLTNNTPAFNPVMALIGPNVTCSGDATCLRTASTGLIGAGENLPVNGLGNGSYFLIVTGDPGGSTCGSFSIAANGSLPVSLQNFSID